jgi:hypothetical protein
MADAGWGDRKDSVYLVLLSDVPGKMGLKIPLTDMNCFFTRPLNALRAMGYAVLGTPGHISFADNGPAVSDAQLESLEPELGGRVYFYVTQGGAKTCLAPF